MNGLSGANIAFWSLSLRLLMVEACGILTIEPMIRECIRLVEQQLTTKTLMSFDKKHLVKIVSIFKVALCVDSYVVTVT